MKNKIKQEMFVKHELPSFEHTLYITQAFIMDCKHGNNFDLLNLKYLWELILLSIIHAKINDM